MSEIRKGKVVGVSSSPNHGFPTYPQERVFIGPQGIPGDAHSGPMRKSFTRPGIEKPNDRPISIVADEVREEMGLRPGDFNEQVLVRGLGDLGDIPIGSRVDFSTGVSLQVVDRAYPCTDLEAHNGPGLIKALARKQEDGTIYTRRGLLASVTQTGELAPGDEVAITEPDKE